MWSEELRAGRCIATDEESGSDGSITVSQRKGDEQQLHIKELLEIPDMALKNTRDKMLEANANLEKCNNLPKHRNVLTACCELCDGKASTQASLDKVLRNNKILYFQ